MPNVLFDVIFLNSDHRPFKNFILKLATVENFIKNSYERTPILVFLYAKCILRSSWFNMYLMIISVTGVFFKCTGTTEYDK